VYYSYFPQSLSPYPFIASIMIRRHVWYYSQILFLFYFSSSCVTYVASFSGLSFCDSPSVFSNFYLYSVNSKSTKLQLVCHSSTGKKLKGYQNVLCLVCTLLPVSLNCHLLIATSVSFNVYFLSVTVYNKTLSSQCNLTGQIEQL